MWRLRACHLAEHKAEHADLHYGLVTEMIRRRHPGMLADAATVHSGGSLADEAAAPAHRRAEQAILLSAISPLRTDPSIVHDPSLRCPWERLGELADALGIEVFHLPPLGGEEGDCAVAISPRSGISVGLVALADGLNDECKADVWAFGIAIATSEREPRGAQPIAVDTSPSPSSRSALRCPSSRVAHPANLWLPHLLGHLRHGVPHNRAETGSRSHDRRNGAFPRPATSTPHSITWHASSPGALADSVGGVVSDLIRRPGGCLGVWLPIA